MAEETLDNRISLEDVEDLSLLEEVEAVSTFSNAWKFLSTYVNEVEKAKETLSATLRSSDTCRFWQSSDWKTTMVIGLKKQLSDLKKMERLLMIKCAALYAIETLASSNDVEPVAVKLDCKSKGKKKHELTEQVFTIEPDSDCKSKGKKKHELTEQVFTIEEPDSVDLDLEPPLRRAAGAPKTSTKLVDLEPPLRRAAGAPKTSTKLVDLEPPLRRAAGAAKTSTKLASSSNDAEAVAVKPDCKSKGKKKIELTEHVFTVEGGQNPGGK